MPVLVIAASSWGRETLVVTVVREQKNGGRKVKPLEGVGYRVGRELSLIIIYNVHLIFQ
jgi:hypothetical protein